MIDEVKVASIIDEEIERSRRYKRENFGARNGDEFIEIAKVLMNNKNICGGIAASFLQALVMIAATNKDDLLKEFDNPEAAAKNETFNKIPLDMFWFGYRLGRRLQLEEDNALRRMEERK